MNKFFRIFLLRLKLFTRNKRLVCLVCIFSVFCSIFLNYFYSTLNNSTRIPIGVIDEDRSELSKNIIEQFRKNQIFDTVQIKENEIEKVIKDFKVSAVFVFKEGFERDLHADNYKEVVKVYSLRDNEFSGVLCDVAAGDIMYDAALSKGTNMLYSLFEKKNINIDRNKLREMIEEYSSKDFAEEKYILPINYKYAVESNENGIETKSISDNRVLLIRVFISINLIIILLFMLFMCSSIIKERNSNVFIRFKAVGVSVRSYLFSNAASVFIIGFVIAVIICTFLNMSLYKLTIVEYTNFLGVIAFFTFSSSMFFILLTVLFHDTKSMNMAVPFIIIILFVLGGGIIDVSILPKCFKFLAYFTPVLLSVEESLRIICFNEHVNVVSLIILFSLGNMYYLISVLVMKIKNQ